MIDARVMTIVRDGDDYIYPCMKVVAPHVSTVSILIDSRSGDQTKEVVRELAREFQNIEWAVYPVENPAQDLVRMRNHQLDFTEEWGLLVDSDEYHYRIADYRLGERTAYAFQCHAPWNDEFGHKASARAFIGRLFRNSPMLEWRGSFGKEKLYDGDTLVFENAPLMPYRYIHFTHLKKDDWRAEMNQERVADGRDLYPLPKDVIYEIKQIHEKV